MASAFIDSLKLVLSDNYEVSDSEYRSLSDTLLKAGLSDSDSFDTGLVQIIQLLIQYNQRLPMSLDCLKELWQSKHITYNFVKMLSELLKTKTISLKKVKKDKFFSNSKIIKSNSEIPDKEIYIVIYSTEKFDNLISAFEKVLTHPTGIIPEGANSLPKKYQDMLAKLGKQLKTIDIYVSIESYVYDPMPGKASLSLVISKTSQYRYTDTDIQKLATRLIKGSWVLSVESYKESKSELFLGLELVQSEINSTQLANMIYSFVDELEVQGV